MSRAVTLLIYENPSRNIVCICNCLLYKMKHILCILLLVFFLKIYLKDYTLSPYIE